MENTMPSIEIVTHAYSPKEVPIYHLLLQLQLSSLIQAPPAIDTMMTICYSPEDELTTKVIDWFEYEKRGIQSLFLKRIPLSKENLFRRAIGRNIVALQSEADVIWMTDCDYLFTDSSTLQLAHYHCINSKLNMVRPETYYIHRSHGFGDLLIERLAPNPPQHLKLDPDHFIIRKEKKAIGGVQIVKRSAIKEIGYLNGTKWTHPVQANKGFKQCRCDVPFRKTVGPSEAVDIPGVYRIRHSRCGRDLGVCDHGIKTRITSTTTMVD